jgi:hypothetical protein
MSAAVVLLLLYAQTPVNADSALVAQFQTRVTDYLKSTAKLRSGLPPLKPTDSRESVTQRGASLALLLTQARSGSAQGEFFTLPIAGEFRRLIGIAFQGLRDRRIRKSLEHAEPVEGSIKVNAAYPPVPLQSMPPTLLANLPELPSDLDYRLIGRTLVLRDVHSNLILDYISKAIP